MRLYHLTDWNPDALRLTERDPPEPGPRQILLRMRAASLNYRDHILIRGGYGRRGGRLPVVPVSDGVGEVVAVGPGVTRFAPGDRACPAFFRGWRAGPFDERFLDHALGGPEEGVMMEYKAVDEESAVAVPAFLSDAEAASLPCAAVTAWTAIVDAGRVRPGDVVVIQGTGGVSLFALQFAKLAGARVIATSSSDDKLERVAAMGADVLVNYRARPDWHKAVRAATGGRGADLVVDVAGGTLPASVRAVRGGGTVCAIGVLAGGEVPIQLGHVVTRGIRLQGITVGSVAGFEAMLRAIETHALKPVVEPRTYGFDALPQALAALPEGRHFGKICLQW